MASTENERRACEIRLRAERKAGQLLAEMEKPNGGRPSRETRRGERRVSDAKTLPELGITRDQSSRWQKLAAVPQDERRHGSAAADQYEGPAI